MTYTLVSTKVKGEDRQVHHVVLQWDKDDGYLVQVFLEKDVPFTAESAEGDNLIRIERKVVGAGYDTRKRAISLHNRRVKKYFTQK
jgi:hypothetical protein